MAELKTTLPNQKHSFEKRAAARKYYLIGLNMPEISKLIDVPIRTVEKWRISEQWQLLKKQDNYEKTIIELYQANESYSRISELMQVTKPTIWRVLKKAGVLKTERKQKTDKKPET